MTQGVKWIRILTGNVSEGAQQDHTHFYIHVTKHGNKEHLGTNHATSSLDNCQGIISPLTFFSIVSSCLTSPNPHEVITLLCHLYERITRNIFKNEISASSSWVEKLIFIYPLTSGIAHSIPTAMKSYITTISIKNLLTINLLSSSHLIIDFYVTSPSNILLGRSK